MKHILEVRDPVVIAGGKEPRALAGGPATGQQRPARRLSGR